MGGFCSFQTHASNKCIRRLFRENALCIQIQVVEPSQLPRRSDPTSLRELLSSRSHFSATAPVSKSTADLGTENAKVLETDICSRHLQTWCAGDAHFGAQILMMMDRNTFQKKERGCSGKAHRRLNNSNDLTNRVGFEVLQRSHSVARF